ncbi:helix-turn-helix transcriptional regulator [Lacticaseibacillus camelliae]|nr:helix-turn-helix transcriptional regulator [Lacticaseibacillus camelliae]
MENRLALLRNEKGLTLKQLGKILNVRDNTLSQYETGKRNPQLGLWEEIADFFNVSLDYLLMHTDKRDYSFSSTEDVIDLLTKFHDKKIYYDNLSKETVLELSLWLLNHLDLFTDGQYKNLLDEVDGLVRYASSEYKMLNEYSKERKKRENVKQQIVDSLDYEEPYDVLPKQVLEFMRLSDRKGWDVAQKYLEKLDKEPDPPEE